MQAALKIFADNLSRYPYCTDNPRDGQAKRARDDAILQSHIQPNTAGRVLWVAFDVDQPDGATAWDRLSAPPPTLAMENPRNGHAHLLYALTAPVPRTDAARAKPLLYLAAAQEGIRRKLQADPGYSGNLCKNPFSARWNVKQWADTYSMGELADWVTLPSPAEMQKRVRDPDYAGLGRNCEMFERLRQVAYRLVRRYWIPGGFEYFRDALRIHADDLSAAFAEPLPMAETRAISASCARWVWKRFTPADFRAIQSKRGARKGADKRTLLLPEVLRLIGEGQSQRKVAAAVGVDQATVIRWLKLS